MNVINDQGRASYGTGLGNQLSQGVQALANVYIKHAHERKVGPIYKQMGLPENFTSLPEEHQKEVLKNHYENQRHEKTQKLQNERLAHAEKVSGHRHNEKMDLQRQKLAMQGQGMGNASQQRQIDATSKKWSEGISKGYENAIATEEDINEALALLDTGKTRAGITGNLPLNWTGGNSESVALNKVYNRLVGRLAAQGGGIPTYGRLRYSEAQKPGLNQPKEAQYYLLKSLLKEVNRAKGLGEIRDRLIAENDYKNPAGLEQRTLEAFNQMHRGGPQNQQPQSGQQQNQMQQQQPQGQGQPYYWPGQGPQQDQQQMQQQGQPQQQQQDPQQGYNAEGESPIGTLARGALRTGSRGLEAVAGAPGDLANLAVGGANWLSGDRIPGAKEIQSILPTSQKFKELASKISGGRTDPQGGIEEFLDDIVGTATSLMAPGKAVSGLTKAFKWAGAGEKATKIGTKVLLPFSGVSMSVPRAVALSSAGELAKTGAGMAGLGTAGQAGAKLITMMVAGKMGMKDIQQAEYAAANESFKNQTSNIKDLSEKIKHRRTSIDKRALSPEVNTAMKEVDKSIDKFITLTKENKGNVPVPKIIEFRQDVSDFMGRTGYNPQNGQSLMPKRARGIIKDILHDIDSELAKASEINNVGGKSLAIANDMTRAIGTFNKTQTWMPTYIPKAVSSVVYKLFKAINAKEQVKNVYDFMTKYPEARDAYFKAMGYAAVENAPGFTREVAKIDNIVKKEK